jgi:predicted RNA binding protein YcfA (HicA-like mRNA interferase family)
VPRLLPASPKKVEKFVLGLGYSLARSSGSHRIYKKEGKKFLIIIPFHSKKEVAKGTLKNDILADLSFNENLELDQLVQMLNEL